jgi:hypothetical protein
MFEYGSLNTLDMKLKNIISKRRKKVICYNIFNDKIAIKFSIHNEKISIHFSNLTLFVGVNITFFEEIAT